MNNPTQSAHPTVSKKWAWHYRALLRVREILLSERVDLEQAVQRSLDCSGANKIGAAKPLTEEDLLLTAIRIEEAELEEVEHALLRILDRSYGKCEKTGRPINDARLRQIPWTRFS